MVLGLLLLKARTDGGSRPPSYPNSDLAIGHKLNLPPRPTSKAIDIRRGVPALSHASSLCCWYWGQKSGELFRQLPWATPWVSIGI